MLCARAPKMMMQMNELCRTLDWDSAFFNCHIARIIPTRLDADKMRFVMRWAEAGAVDCLYFLAAGDDRDTVRLAEDAGFRFVGMRVTLACVIQASQAAPPLRFAVPDDIPILRSIAQTAYRASRFYYDGNFSPTQCDALYETWIENSCKGYADAVLVAEHAGKPSGYITCHLRDGLGEIGLVGVDASVRGGGIGGSLVHAALAFFANHAVETVSVVTQGRNVGALRFYQRCGFLIQSVQLWYHRWFH